MLLQVAHDGTLNLALASCAARAEWLGRYYHYRTEMATALESYQQALQLFQQVGSKLGEANCYLVQGRLLLEQEEYEKALGLHTEAYDLYREIQDSYSQCAALYYRSVVYAAMSERELAIQDVEAALVIAERLSLPQADLLREWRDELQK